MQQEKSNWLYTRELSQHYHLSFQQKFYSSKGRHAIFQVNKGGSDQVLEKGMATHSSILAWRIPWTEEPGGLESTGLQLDTAE